jgi:hypothetical protein
MGAEKHANDDKIQSEGRKDNAAQHLNAAEPNAGAERYPPAGKDDAVESAGGERRTFEGSQNPKPRQGAGDGGADPSLDQSRAKRGSEAPTAEEGKR